MTVGGSASGLETVCAPGSADCGRASGSEPVSQAWDELVSFCSLSSEL